MGHRRLLPDWLRRGGGGLHGRLRGRWRGRSGRHNGSGGWRRRYGRFYLVEQIRGH
ncbi:hypothetical protein NUKP48_16120 [Klebsiella quasipneumoniae]|nr:hypothetical protein NUKP48_16120 [Klebsiella quasipneumoniae]